MEEDEGKDGAGAEADGGFDYSTLAEAMDASDDADGSNDSSGDDDIGIDGLGGGPARGDRGSPPEASGMHPPGVLLRSAGHFSV